MLYAHGTAGAERKDGLDEKALILLCEKDLVKKKVEGRTTFLKRVSS